jgi:hypothetical protein
MTCDDCHRVANVNDALPYPGAQLQPTSLSTSSAASSNSTAPPRIDPRAYFASPEFAKHCAGCHVLEFDRRFGTEQVPHDKQQVVHDFLKKKFSDYIATHPDGELSHQSSIDRCRRPHARKWPQRQQWVTFRVEDAEWLLDAKTCKQCLTATWRPATPL